MPFDVDAYLDRIGFTGDRAPTLANVAALQYSHLHTVPFENLHVFHRCGVQVGEDWSYRKIGTLEELPVAADDWARTLRDHFDLDVPDAGDARLRNDR